MAFYKLAMLILLGRGSFGQDSGPEVEPLILSYAYPITVNGKY